MSNSDVSCTWLCKRSFASYYLWVCLILQISLAREKTKLLSQATPFPPSAANLSGLQGVLIVGLNHLSPSMFACHLTYYMAQKPWETGLDWGLSILTFNVEWVENEEKREKNVQTNEEL